MLDANIDRVFSIEAALPDKSKGSPKALLLRACNVYAFDNARIYSELEEQTFSALNRNNGCGVIDIEFVFENSIVSERYPKFYTKCFVIRTDEGNFIKPMKFSNSPSSSKINQRGELVIGIRYFFRNESEMKNIIKCKNILVEGFIALGKSTNVFGIMCQLRMKNKHWKIVSAYTFKPHYAKNIKNLID